MAWVKRLYRTRASSLPNFRTFEKTRVRYSSNVSGYFRVIDTDCLVHAAHIAFSR
jgi:hypothetical protein